MTTRTKQTHMEEAITHATHEAKAAAAAHSHEAHAASASTAATAAASGRSSVFSSDRSREWRLIFEQQRRIHKQAGQQQTATSASGGRRSETAARAPRFSHAPPARLVVGCAVTGDDPSAASTAAAVSAIAPIQPLTPFTDSASHLSTSIRRLADFLASQRAEYLDLHRHLSSSAPGRKGKALSNADRDRLEEEISLQIRLINAKIDELKASITPPPQQSADADDDEEAEDDPATRAARDAARAPNPDLRAHQHTVIILLFDALRAVAASMASLKAQRTAQMRAEMEERHPGALALRATQEREREQHRRNGGTASDSAAASSSGAHIDSTSSAAAAAAASAVEMLPAVLGKAVGKIQSRIGGGGGGGKDAAMTASKKSGAAEAKYGSGLGSTKDSALPPVDDGPTAAAPALVFSAHEQAQLLSENHHLLDSLEDNLDAMKRAESSMASIAELMSLFQTKVLQQEEQIETIYDQAIQSTLHVHSGIKQLQQAIQRGVTFRMMILFMILVLSFSLLFLDWYIS